MVLQPQNSQDPGFICCCCPDCCEVLSNARRLPRPAEYFQPNYQARIDAERCSGCKTCLKRCPMQALAVAEKQARVDPQRCIACGLCVTTCREQAIRLEPRRRQRVPPRNMQQMYQKIMLERYGPLRSIGKAARLLMGMKL